MDDTSAAQIESQSYSNESQDTPPTDSALAETFIHDWYIRVKASFTATSTSAIVAQIAIVEQKVAALYENLKSQLNSQNTKLFPGRFIDESDTRTDKAYTCYWLIGLPVIALNEITKARKLVREWETQIRAELPMDKVQGKFVTRDAILQQSLKPEIPIEALTSLKNKKPEVEMRKTGESFKKTKNSNPKQIRQQFLRHAMGGETSAKGSSPGGKLRPAKDVLNRLKYDSRYNIKDYVVGYIDRKAGILEKPVEEWQEYEEEELIAYFKHVPDEELVWDRARKVDSVSHGRD
ncbi:uncharacterized protein LY89DRAFT_743177 [Mollisia scopiformis]|uniref:MJ1316 RNA cyclic group end recognition domain-containing protein n=1 Tax=Mollisia scopiformis TaxID=149040 RepID=A0A132B5B9_MOLSC|nr:uncharacterized protein LY89DRAFT_743177 [Mollisia scopiformis]KUJ07179.1 hypothetical protein LY89DRAFT_743177 [Mollisia scopiformis]